MSGGRTFGRCVGLAIAALATLAAAAPIFAQMIPRHSGRVEAAVPDPVTDGDWNGTWYYASAECKMALWMRTGPKGKVELKLRYDSLSRPISFETDWTGSADYYISAKRSTFRIALAKTGRDRLEGTWSWSSELPGELRTERGSITLFRAFDGRQLVFRFHDFEAFATTRKGTGVTDVAPVWTFLKGSRRLVLWDELPF